MIAAAPVDARVLLAGAFGQGNPGDEALLTAFARALPGAELVATSSAPEATEARHRLPAVARNDVRAIGGALRASDAVVFAGGTIFKRLHPAAGRRPLALLAGGAALAAGAKAQRKLLAVVAAGAGSLDGFAAPRLARSIVRAADLLVLRDDESAERLAAAGAPAPMRVGADAAWTLPLAPHAGAGDAGGAVVVALSHLAGGRELSERLGAALAPLRSAGVAVALQPWQRDGDTALARALVERLGAGTALLEPPADLAAASAALGGARLVLGLRFHSLVAAAAAGVPFVAFAHEPKLAAAARRLGQPAVDPTAAPEAVTAALSAALDAPAAPPAAIRRERERAEDGFRLLRVLLARGRSEEAPVVDGLALRPEEWL